MNRGTHFRDGKTSLTWTSPTFWKPGLLGACLVAALLVTGCASSGLSGKSTSEDSEIDDLNLVALPMPVNVSGRPGSADGIAVKVYGINRQRPKAQPIRSGTLELLLYDGLAHKGVVETNRLVHAWTFPASDLAGHSFVTTVGTGYLFSLAWQNNPPRGSQITVVARHVSSKGSVISSAPNFIAISPPVSPK